MKIILKEDQSLKPVFGDVKVNQFFVDCYGYLCQKHSSDSYNVITDANGRLVSERVDAMEDEDVIDRILPEVLKIEF
jgi:hypothetical protein